MIAAGVSGDNTGIVSSGKRGVSSTAQPDSDRELDEEVLAVRGTRDFCDADAILAVRGIAERQDGIALHVRL